MLDLGCGDGALLAAVEEPSLLVGVDLSRAELRAAAARLSRGGPLLLQARAQALPLESATFDVALSQMSLMLMADVESVLGEVARVLRPGDRLSVLVGAGTVDEDEAWGRFLSLVRPVIEAAPVERRSPALGDPRVREPEALGRLVRAAGFVDLTQERAVLDLSGRPDEVWATVSPLYDVLCLGHHVLDRVRERFLADAGNLADGEGVVPCRLPVRTLVSTKPTDSIGT